MIKIIIPLLLVVTSAIGQSVTISPTNPEHIKVVKVGTARLDLEGRNIPNSSAGNSQINLYSKGDVSNSGFFPVPVDGESSINFLNTGNSTPIFTIQNSHQDYLVTSNLLKIKSGANNLINFRTTGSISFPMVDATFDSNQRVVFGTYTTATNKTNFNVNSRVGNTHAIFGNDYTGVSIESDWPGIGLNGYYNGSRRPISDGFIGGISLNPSNGKFTIYNSSTSGTAGSSISQFDRIVIDNQGEVGIGVSDPTASLHVARGTGVNGTAAFVGTTHSSHFNYATNEHTFIRGGKDGANVYINDVAALGNVAVGLGVPTEKLHVFGNLRVAGNVCYTGTIGACSDLRFKKNFTKIENPLHKVLALNGLHYDWRVDEFKENNFSTDRQIGFIAQEIEKIFPEMVITDANGYKSVDYARLTPVLVEAMKEQQKMIEELKIKNEKLEVNNQKLESRLNKIEAMLNN